jgi:hypothetical protein
MTTATFTRTSDLTADVLLREVRLELVQPEFAARTHGKPSTFRAGCRGHLCRYIERTRRREMRQVAALTELPQGVRPDVRPRGEQRWDPVLACIREYVSADELDDLTVGIEVMEQLGLQEMERFSSLITTLRQGRLLDGRSIAAALER